MDASAPAPVVDRNLHHYSMQAFLNAIDLDSLSLSRRSASAARALRPEGGQSNISALDKDPMPGRNRKDTVILAFLSTLAAPVCLAQCRVSHKPEEARLVPSPNVSRVSRWHLSMRDTSRDRSDILTWAMILLPTNKQSCHSAPHHPQQVLPARRG